MAGRMKHKTNQTLLALAALALLAGCSEDLLGAISGPAANAPAVGLRVDPALSATLSSDAATATYKASDGHDVTLTLGAPYASARGQTCRVGRAEGDRMAYGFCRSGADWFAVPPAVVSGN